MLVAAGNVDFASSWLSIWNAVSGQIGGVTTVLDYAGVAIVILALATYLWERRRGGSANHSKLIWSAIFGALLSAPGAIIPAILVLLDFLINAFISVFPSGAAGASTGTIQPSAMVLAHHAVTYAHVAISSGLVHSII